MKVYPFKIPKRPNENIILQIDRSPQFYDKLHSHEEIQLSYIVQGKGKLIVGNEVTTFESGDFVAIGSNVPHLFLSQIASNHSHMISIFFTMDSFGTVFFQNQEMEVLKPLFQKLPYGFKSWDDKDFIKDLFLELKNENKFELFLGLLKLLSYLSKKETTQILQEPHTFRISKNQGQRLQIVFDDVMQHFQNEISLKEISDKVHMSKNAFCRFFKERTNKTFFQFLAEIRIQHACELLRESPETSIAEIATLSGYNTISNFNRQFKNIKNVSPRTFRNQLTKIIQ